MTVQLERATTIILETVRNNPRVVEQLVKGLLLAIVKMELEGKNLDPRGRDILIEIYKEFPGLETQVQEFIK